MFEFLNFFPKGRLKFLAPTDYWPLVYVVLCCAVLRVYVRVCVCVCVRVISDQSANKKPSNDAHVALNRLQGPCGSSKTRCHALDLSN